MSDWIKLNIATVYPAMEWPPKTGFTVIFTCNMLSVHKIQFFCAGKFFFAGKNQDRVFDSIEAI